MFQEIYKSSDNSRGAIELSIVVYGMVGVCSVTCWKLSVFSYIILIDFLFSYFSRLFLFYDSMYL